MCEHKHRCLVPCNNEEEEEICERKGLCMLEEGESIESV